MIRVSYKGSVADRSSVESILNDQCCVSAFKSMKVEDSRIICSYLISLKSHDSLDSIVKILEDQEDLNKVKVYVTTMEN